MKILFYVNYPLAWAKGGYTIHIRKTIETLEQHGVQVEWLHDDQVEPPEADILHYWARPPNDQHWQLARQRGLKLIITELMNQGILRSSPMRSLRAAVRPLLPRLLGAGVYGTLGLDIYRHCHAAVVLNPAEGQHLNRTFGTPHGRIFVIPPGVSDEFFDYTIIPEPFDGLIYPAFIRPGKNQVAVAEAARRLRIPVRFIGGRTTSEDAYFQAFKRSIDGHYVTWLDTINDRRRLSAVFRGARGVFLASHGDCLPMSLLEALAAGRPVMAPKLRNVASYFGNSVRYAPPPPNREFDRQLRCFYEETASPVTPPAASNLALGWEQVTNKLLTAYQFALQGDAHDSD